MLNKTKPNIDYIRILGSLAYIFNPKEKRDNKLINRANKGILIGYRSSNNFIVYIPSINQIIDSVNIVIKEDLIYKDEYIVKEDYLNLLESTSLDFDYIRSYISPSLPDNNLEDNIDELGDLPSPSPNRARPDPSNQDNNQNSQDEEEIEASSDLDELGLDY